MTKQLLSYLLLFVLLITTFTFPATAVSNIDPTDATIAENNELQDEPPTTQVPLHAEGSGFKSYGFLTDGDKMHYYSSKGACSIRLKGDEQFNSLYLMFDLECDVYTITDDATNESITAGKYGFLHEYIPLPFSTSSVTITFPSEVTLSEITAYTGGTPTDIQIWEPPLEGETDILLLATHGDDDHLFFAGLLPLYAGELNYNVQVAYWTNHRPQTRKRTHEMLNGLWAVGVTSYPVFGPFEDFRQDTLDMTYYIYNYRGITNEELLSYVLSLVRRFDPQVVVCHDFNGEYGHGMHMLYTDLLIKALDISNNPNAYPEIAQQYGVWDVPKTYVHLYEENPIVLDYDQPLEAFHGMTAFQVSQELGFPCHVSQQKETLFTNWLYGYGRNITKATQIKQYNPCLFGLYRSTVGADEKKNDFMENIISYEEQAQLAEEARLKAEAERLEAERLEAERLEAERLEAERLEAEQIAKQEAEKAQQLIQQEEAEALANATKQRQIIILTVLGSSFLIVLTISALLLIRRKRTATNAGTNQH